MYMETVSECELNCLELGILELEKILTTSTKKQYPSIGNIFFPNSTIDLNDYVSGIENYTIYYTIDKITEPDGEGTYNPSEKADTSITEKFKNNKYTIQDEGYGIYEVYETNTKKLLTRFVIITGSEGAGYYDIHGNIIEGGKITEDIYTLSYNYKPEGEVAWVIVPNTVKKFEVVNFMGVFDNSELKFPKLIACYFEKHETRDVSGDLSYMFLADLNLVAVNYNDIISSMKDTVELHMPQMFSGCNGIISVSFDKGVFNKLTVGLLDMQQMFDDCNGITSVSFDKGAFSELTVGRLIMNYMFNNCPFIENIELNDVFSLTALLYINLFVGSTTNINTISIKEKNTQYELYKNISISHDYNLFNFISKDKTTNTNNSITLVATDAVVKMLLGLNPVGGTRQISLTYTANTELGTDNEISYAFTLTYINNVWNIDTHP